MLYYYILFLTPFRYSYAGGKFGCANTAVRLATQVMTYEGSQSGWTLPLVS
jgi:hypothetical protein